MQLLHILRLFADSLKLVLEFDCRFRQLERVCLAGYRVDFAPHLLTDKVHLPTDGVVFVQRREELGDVAFKPRDFLANVAFVGKYANFFQHALVVRVEFEVHRGESLQKQFLVLLRRSVRELLDVRDYRRD